MKIEILEVNHKTLAQLATVPSRFLVRSKLVPRLAEKGLGGIALREEGVSPFYVKDYDVLDGEGPSRRLRRHDVSNWRLILAREGKVLVGGAVVVAKSPGLHMLQGREDLAMVWDIRVRPGSKRKGVGTRLFREAASWARAKDCARMAVETQNINVPACRF